MTAVEWLQEQQKELLNQVKSGEFKIEDFEYYNALYIEQAKEMERERIIKTYEVGISRGTNYEEDVYHKNNWRSGEKYYNETFKSE